MREYHDNPSLEHLDELSTDIFDSPRVQVRDGEGRGGGRGGRGGEGGEGRGEGRGGRT